MTTLVREVIIKYSDETALPISVETIKDAKDVVSATRPIFEGSTREMVVALFLDVRLHPIGYSIVSIGTLTASLISPREIYQAALKANAANVILLHNHPSGDPTPSAEDRQVTDQVMKAGELLGITCLDHIIVTDKDYYSLKQHG